MELLQSLSGGLVAAAAVFIVAWLGKERYDARFGSMDTQFQAVREEMRQLREDARQTRHDLANLRSDLLNVALRAKPDAS